MQVSVSHVAAICALLVAAASQSPVINKRNAQRALFPGLKFEFEEGSSSNHVKFEDTSSSSVKFEDQQESSAAASGYGSTGPSGPAQFTDPSQHHYDRSYKPVKFDSSGSASNLHMSVMRGAHIHPMQEAVHPQQTVHLVQPVQQLQPIHTVQAVQPVQTVQTLQPVQTVHVQPTLQARPRPIHPYSYVVDSAPANTLGAAVYAEHHGDYHKTEHSNLEKRPSPWRKLVRVLAAAIPIGLFLAALPPNVVHINATQAVKPLGTVQRQRSDQQSFPILDLIERLGGLAALRHPGCEAHVFCEMARMGSTPAANMVQRTLWSMANETPEEIIELLGAKDLLTAVRTDSCSKFECPQPPEEVEEDPQVLQPVGQNDKK